MTLDTRTSFDIRNEELGRGISVIRELAATTAGSLVVHDLLDVVSETAEIHRARAAGAIAELVDDHEFHRIGDGLLEKLPDLPS